MKNKMKVSLLKYDSVQTLLAALLCILGGLLIGFIVLLIIAVILGTGAALILAKRIVTPVETMTKRVASLGGENLQFKMEPVYQTGDEIEELSESLKQMEFDMNNNIMNLLHVTNELNTTKDQVQQMNKLAYKDGLTGVKNRLGYDQKMEELSQKAKNGYRSFGMAVIDLNDLKHINDTYGHERGNLSILAIAKKICTTFAHSPVFRIGGDEFAVILENSDFENRDKLIQQFEASLKEPAENPWEQITAAIGYVTYHEGESMEQFFDRADQNMYQRKQQMKKSEQ